MYNIKIDDSKANLHYLTIKDSLLKRISYILDKKTIIKKGVKYGIVNNNSSLNIYLLKIKDENELKRLIISHSTEIREIIREVNSIDSTAFIPPTKEEIKAWKNDGIIHEDFNVILYHIFIDYVYNNMRFNKTKFLNDHNLDTCPYCNRSYIYSVKKSKVSNGRNNTIELKTQIDHFYPKSKYPFLGMSYYNLIPSCLFCNSLENKGDESPSESNDKPEETLRILNPYEINPDDFKFSFDIIDFGTFQPKAFKVKLNFPKNFQEGYESFFGLKSLYENHNDHVEEIYSKVQKYNQTNKDNIDNILKTADDTIDFDRLYYGYYSLQKDFHKRPLSKFYSDIVKRAKELTHE